MMHSTYDKFYFKYTIYSNWAGPTTLNTRWVFYVAHKLLWPSNHFKNWRHLWPALCLQASFRIILFDSFRFESLNAAYNRWSKKVSSTLLFPFPSRLRFECRSSSISCPYKSSLFADLSQMGVCMTIYLHCKFNLFATAATATATSATTTTTIANAANFLVQNDI